MIKELMNNWNIFHIRKEKNTCVEDSLGTINRQKL